jgi:hypothetical protein
MEGGCRWKHTNKQASAIRAPRHGFLSDQADATAAAAAAAAAKSILDMHPVGSKRSKSHLHEVCGRFLVRSFFEFLSRVS